jgi:hypothetical protein
MLKGNKGDWSEFYVFVKLLSEGKLFQSDIKLNRDENNYYEVVKAYREEGKSSLEFERNGNILLYSVSDGNRNLIGDFSIEYLKEISEKIYTGIINGSGKSFEIPTIEDFIENSKIQKLTAKVTSKSDIRLRIYDHRLAKEADLGFSIKSLLGEDSTLFNTGLGNNFIYGIKTNETISIPDLMSRHTSQKVKFLN